MLNFLKNIGPTEFLLILCILVLVFGANTISNIAKRGGDTLKEVKKIRKDLVEAVKEVKDDTTEI